MNQLISLKRAERHQKVALTAMFRHNLVFLVFLKRDRNTFVGGLKSRLLLRHLSLSDLLSVVSLICCTVGYVVTIFHSVVMKNTIRC